MSGGAGVGVGAVALPRKNRLPIKIPPIKARAIPTMARIIPVRRLNVCLLVYKAESSNSTAVLDLALLGELEEASAYNPTMNSKPIFTFKKVLIKRRMIIYGGNDYIFWIIIN
jgi:hypothetical protein